MILNNIKIAMTISSGVVSELAWRRSDTHCEYTEATYKKAGVICIDNCGRHLLVKGKESNKWGFPKGGVEGNESLLDCALREFKEETGYTLEKKHVFVGNTFECHQCMYFIVYVDTTSVGVRPIPYTVTTENIDQNEIVDMDWLKLSELSETETNFGLKMYKSGRVDSRRRRSNQLNITKTIPVQRNFARWFSRKNHTRYRKY